MIELLRKRRSIRKFTAEKIAPEAIETIIEAALRSPSSRGINPLIIRASKLPIVAVPWCFIRTVLLIMTNYLPALIILLTPMPWFFIDDSLLSGFVGYPAFIDHRLWLSDGNCSNC